MEPVSVRLSSQARIPVLHIENTMPAGLRTWLIPLLIAFLLLLLLPSTEMKRTRKGKGLKGVRQKLTQDRYGFTYGSYLSSPFFINLIDHFDNDKPWIIIFFVFENHVRVRGAGRHSRSGPFRLVASPDCSESTESGDVFVDCQDRGLISIPTSQTWSKEPKHFLLARNRIKVLQDRAFLGYESLTSLDLQQNQISLVEEGAFQGLRRLTTLLLQHNRLGTLSEEALIPMSNLRYLRLYDNPWKCLCPLDSLIRTLQVPSNRNLGNHARWVILHKAFDTVWSTTVFKSLLRLKIKISFQISHFIHS